MNISVWHGRSITWSGHCTPSLRIKMVLKKKKKKKKKKIIYSKFYQNNLLLCYNNKWFPTFVKNKKYTKHKVILQMRSSPNHTTSDLSWLSFPMYFTVVNRLLVWYGTWHDCSNDPRQHRNAVYTANHPSLLCSLRGVLYSRAPSHMARDEQDLQIKYFIYLTFKNRASYI
jgi:hypothetical protein